MNSREANTHRHTRPETNPHFSRQRSQQPRVPVVPLPRHGQPPPPSLPLPPGGAPTQQEDVPYPDHFPLHHTPADHLPIPQAPPPESRSRLPSKATRTRREDQSYPPPRESRGKQPRGVVFAPTPHEIQPSPPGKPPGSPVVPPPSDHPAEPRLPRQDPHRQPHHERRVQDVRLPQPKTTKAHTWFLAVFCVIFWLVIIIGGLIVLIVYLVFRPQSPHFEVSSVTLNAAYLDFGYLFNADLTMLANFTNPNKKVHVDFSSVTIYLYYGRTLVAAQYVEPFSAAKAQSRFANIHLVSSQVQLPLSESERLMKQMESNGVLFEVLGVFRARSKLGSILRYSYNLYGDCNVMVTRPPDGILLKKKCRTKR